MTLPDQPSDSRLPEDIVDQLARRDEKEAVDDSSEAAPTLRSLHAELETLASELRAPAPHDEYADEADCRRALQLIGKLGTSPKQADESIESRQLGQYQLLNKLGEGGMGAVYKALHTRLDKIVAIKVLPQQRTQDPIAISRFEREMKAVGKLEHTNIVRAMDANEHEGVHYLVMEYVDGMNLSELARRIGPLPIADACELVLQAAIGLQHAYESGLVHRDIKPSNLMLTKHGQLKILDLGLARLHSSTHGELTTTGQLMGTLDYMAPEQGADSHDVDIRADVYSLGATLFRLIAGNAPFASGKYDSPIKLMRALALEPAPSLATKRSDVPTGLDSIVADLLVKDPQERPSTPQEVADALSPFAVNADLVDLFKRASDASMSATVNQVSAATKEHITSDSHETAPTQEYVHSDPSLNQSPAASHSKQTAAPVDQPAEKPAISNRASETSPPWWGSRRNQIVALVAVAVLTIAAVVFMRVRTSNGWLEVEIDDPKITATMRTDGLQIEDLENGRRYTIQVPRTPDGKEGDKWSSQERLPSGEYRVTSESLHLLVLDDNGAEVKTNKFTLRRNQRLRVRVTLIADARPVSVPSSDPKTGVASTDSSSPQTDASGKDLADTASVLKPVTTSELPPGQTTIRPSDGWVDLMPLLKLPPASTHGDWQRAGNSLLAVGGEDRRLPLPLDPMGGFILRATYESSSTSASVACRVNVHHALVLLDKDSVRLARPENEQRIPIVEETHDAWHPSGLNTFQIALSQDDAEIRFVIELNGITVLNWKGPESALYGSKTPNQESYLLDFGDSDIRVHQLAIHVNHGQTQLLGYSVNEIAQWVLDRQGMIGVVPEGGSFAIVDRVPTQPFELAGIFLQAKMDVSDEDLIVLRHLPQVRSLDLSGCRITNDGVRHLRIMPLLRSLNLAGTRVTDAGIPQLRHCKNLVQVDVSKTTVSAASIAKLRILKPECEIASDFSEDSISTASTELFERNRNTAVWALKNGAAIGIWHDDQGFLNIRHGDELPDGKVRLVSIDFLGRRLSADSLSRLNNLESLTTLNFNGTAIDNDQVANMANLPCLEKVYCGTTDIGDEGLDKLTKFPSISRLHLGGTNVTDSGIEYLRNWPDLIELRLELPALSDKSAATLSNLRKLESLWLIDTSVTDDTLLRLASLRRLKLLDVSGTHVSAWGVATLARELPGCDVISSITDEELNAARVAIPHSANETKDPVFTTLFDGTDIEEWSITGDGKWAIESGVIVSEELSPKTGGSSLLTRERFESYELHFEFRLPDAQDVIPIVDKVGPSLDSIEWNVAFGATKPTKVSRNVWHKVVVVERDQRLSMHVDGERVGEHSYGGDDNSGHLGFRLLSKTVEYRDIRVRRVDSED